MTFSPEDEARIRWNCIMSACLNDRMTMVAIRANEAIRIHRNRSESSYAKRRAEKESKFIFRVELPEGFVVSKPLPPGITFSLFSPPPDLPNAADL
jgi:hypothetical protein